MKKGRIVLAAVFAVAVIGVLCVTVFSDDIQRMFQAGAYYGEQQSGDESVVAVYKDTPVTQEMVEYHQNIDSLRDEVLKENKTDREIVDQIILGLILVEEAESRGLAATDEEVREMVAFLKENYEQYPETAETVNTFCEGAGISLEEYWANMEENGHGTISRRKLELALNEAYCKERGLDVDALTPEEKAGMDAAYEAYRDGLLEAHRGDIVYSTD